MSGSGYNNVCGVSQKFTEIIFFQVDRGKAPLYYFRET